MSTETREDQDVSGLDREVDGIRDVVESYSRSGLLVSMTVRTEAGGRRWTQSFTHQFLGEEALIAELSREGLRFDRWIDRSFEWCLARPE